MKKLGFIESIWKQKCRSHIDLQKIQRPKKACHEFHESHEIFLYWYVCILNSYVIDRLQMAAIIFKCWNVWEKMSGGKHLSCGETTPNSSILTIHQLAQLLNHYFWQKLTQLWFLSHHTYPTSAEFLLSQT